MTTFELLIYFYQLKSSSIFLFTDLREQQEESIQSQKMFLSTTGINRRVNVLSPIHTWY